MAISVPSVSGEEASEAEADLQLLSAAVPAPEDDIDDDAEEEEPQLLYERTSGGDLAALLASDALSAVALSAAHTAVGTRAGVVALLDAAGKLVRQFPALRGPINDVGFDADGGFVAAACEDGSVSVSAVTGDDRAVFSHGAAVKSVALDPGYSTKKSRLMAVGTLNGLVLSTKGWMGVRDHVLHSGEGAVRCVRWCGTLIAWANDAGVKLYDTGAHARVAHIARPAGSPKPDTFPPRLAWQDESTLIIGWADCVKVARVSVRGIRPEEAVDALEHGMDRGLGAVCVHAVDVVAAFQTDCFVSGVAPLSPGRLVLLGYTPPPSGGRGRGGVPEVRVVTWTNAELSADALALRGHDGCGPGQLLLAWHTPPGAQPPAPLGGAASGPCFWAPGEAPRLVVAAPRDCVAARPRDVAAHVAWLVSLGRFGQAVDMCDAAEAAGLADAPGAASAAGAAWIDALLARNCAPSAAALCPRLLRGDAAAWEATVVRFGTADALPALAKVMPLEQPLLARSTYDAVLASCMASPRTEDHAALVAALRAWPVSVYDPHALAGALRSRIAAAAAQQAQQADDAALHGTPPGTLTAAGGVPLLKEALALVLLADGQTSAALGLLLELGSPSALPLLAHHRLVGAVADRVASLAAQDHEAVAPLLVEERNAVAPSSVVAQLRAGACASNPACQRLLQRYLAELHATDPGAAAPFAGLAVELTAKWAPHSLMGLLASSASYPLEDALRAAADAGLVAEQVFVLGRMGDARRALGLILDAMGDVDQALEFVQAQGDGRLWDELVRRAGAAPQLAGALLERIGSSADARPLLAALPTGARIDRLRERLVKLLTDVRALCALWQGCAACLRADVVAGSRAMYAGAARAMRPSAVRWADE